MSLKIPRMTIQPQSTPVYAFGSFRLDPATRVLTRDGVPVPLFPKVLDTLIVLVESGGEVVSKEELMARVWPDTFVQESNLTQNIFLLRKLLGGEDQQWIETVPRRGYRFASDVSPAVDEVIVSRRTRVHIVDEEVTTEPATRRWWIAGAAALVVVAGGFGVSRLVRRDSVAAPPPAAVRLPSLIKLTHESRAFDPAISPDGRFVAFKVLRDGEPSVWLKEIARGSSTVVMPPSRYDYRGLTFSPDGSELFYKTYRDDEKNALIVRVPILGGTPREVARNVWSDFAVSPDGREVAFVRSGSGEGATMAVMVARADGSGERKVAESIHATTWFTLWESAPAWSPDGKRIALCGWRRDGEGDHPRLYDVEVASGTTREMAIPNEWTSVSQVAWLGDGSGLVVSATTGTAPSQLWLLEAKGAARRITNDTNGYRKLKVSADARLLVVEQHLRDDHLWILPDGDASRARQMTVGVNDADGYFGVAWTPDRRVVFVSDRTGQHEIWSMRPDGTDVRQITTGSPSGNLSVDVSPDGKHIVFVTDRTGRSNVWRVDADGRNPRQLTRGEGAGRPDVSPDGRWVYYVNSGVMPTRIERVPIDGGAPVALPTRAACGSPAVSPDGTRIAIDHYDEERGWRNGVMPATGGEEPRLFDWHSNRGIVRWTADSRALLYVDGANLWRQPLDGGPARQVTHFPPGITIWNFAVAGDGRDLAIVRGSELSDIVLIRDFR